mmetsp:Transcript_23927/g.68469  ORF Transcript_23927/g.68469 Transcript_23927/m.68469 type:complete len:693 (+) Transcript_23927:68-2146(+)
MASPGTFPQLTTCGPVLHGPARSSLLKHLARFSSPGLAASAGSSALVLSGRRCTDHSVWNVAVALRVPSSSIRRLRALCRKDRRCPRRAGSRLHWKLGEQDSSAWFAACVPIRCLGHDGALLAVAWQLLWYKLAAMWAAPGVPPAGVRVEVLRIFGDAKAPPVPEVPLAHESVDRAGEDGPFDIVTVTDAPERAAGLRQSVPWPLRLRFLRPADGQKPWRFRWFDTERHLLSYVSHLRRRGSGDRLVIYADGFDTAWLGCTRDLSAALEALGRQMFFGVEFDLYPAGLPGYPRGARSHTQMVDDLGKERGWPLPLCREQQELKPRWEPEPPNETEPCLAVTGADEFKAVYLNGGVYGGRAAALEAALRRFLARQRLLSTHTASGEAYRVNGRTHQYLWNQYFLDRWHEVGLDYGGSFVVNLARRSVAPQHFGLAEDSTLRSVLFQRPVCIGHANGAGWADSTLSLLRAAATFHFDTISRAGVPPEEFDQISTRPLQADNDKGDRILLDTSMCFPRMQQVVGWHGALSSVDLITPEMITTYQGMQLVVLRYRGVRKGGPGSSIAHAFEVIEAQHTSLWKYGGSPRSNESFFSFRQRFDVSPFRLHVHQGDCIGWRCEGRCDLAYADFTGFEDWFAPEEASGSTYRRGVWLGQARGNTRIGDIWQLDVWKPRAYILGMMAEVTGISFYEPEDGG